MYKLRAEITKGEAVRYISHLDYAAAIERAIRRAKLPAAYSEGFNPHMKLSFASALAVGVTSAAEYMDIELKEAVTAEAFQRRMRAALPEGIEIVRVEELEGKQPALMSVVDLAAYTICDTEALGAVEDMEASLARFNQAEEVYFVRVTPKSKKEIEIKQYLARPITLDVYEGGIYFHVRVRITPTGSVKPGEIFQVLKDKFALPVTECALSIHREGLYAEGKRLL